MKQKRKRDFNEAGLTTGHKKREYRSDQQCKREQIHTYREREGKREREKEEP